MFDIEFLTHTIHMAIKLVNALRNFRIEDNEVEIQKFVSFLINNCGYKESQINAALVIQDYDYIELSEYYGHYEIRNELESVRGFTSSQESDDDSYESVLNRVIPNREPSQHTKYSATAKKLMLTEDNNVQRVTNQQASLRTRLMELFAEQKKWQKQLQEVGEDMTLDDVRNQIRQANERIAKHQEIIVKCEDSEKKHGKEVSIMVPIEEADGEYTIPDVVYYGDEPVDVYHIYSIEHSQKRIAFWKGEIAKHEQKLRMMEIAQQQLAQVMKEITDIHDQIQNATTCQTSELLVEEQSNEVENASIPENNKAGKDWIYTDKATSEDKERFKDYIEYLCKNDVSAQIIKDYIKEQENENILVPIKPTKQYDLLKEIGVRFQKKTFLNK